MSLLDMDERFLNLIDRVDFDRSPIDDIKHLSQRCAIGIIEGGCCNEDNVHVLLEFRRNCDILVSVGDCATMGGIPALRNNIPLQACIDEAYRTGVTVYNPDGVTPQDPDLPLLLDRVYPCHEVVKIDCFLPGCPPSADALWAALSALLAGTPVELPYELLKYD